MEKCTLKLVDDYKHMLCQATEPLSTFLEYITYVKFYFSDCSSVIVFTNFFDVANIIMSIHIIWDRKRSKLVKNIVIAKLTSAITSKSLVR